ncbi:unnamed protein product [Closterium sp. NIES-65]|nr:unnamed protein product [Closterium sp. NIES-65]
MVSWRDLKCRIVAIYLPAKATARGIFFHDELSPFVQGLAASPYTVLIGDLNIVADPELDKSSKLGTPAENQKLLQICSRWDLQDAFRSLHPTCREFTFFSRSARTSTRIDRVLVSHSLLGCVTEAKHCMVPYGLTDHWFAVKVALKAAAADDHSPGLWRHQAPRPGGEGVKNIISAVVTAHESSSNQSLERLVVNMRACMRAHVTEERKRVRATLAHLEQKVEELRWKVMADAKSQGLYEKLVKAEAALKLYHDSNKERLQVMTGMLMELVSETPSGFLSGLVKSRKAKTDILELVFKGTQRKGAKEVLQASSEHFREVYAESPPNHTMVSWPIDESKMLQEKDQLQLGAEWSEKEALLDRHFIFWSYELSCRGGKEGGLGVIDLKQRIDSTVIQNLGKVLAEQVPLWNWLWERAAGFPLGLATIYAHPSVLKHWLGGGMRWKAVVKALWESKIVTMGDSAHRWDAEEEQLLFNRKIFFRGGSPFGNQAGSLCLKGVRLGDLVAKGTDGGRSLKSESEGGGAEAAQQQPASGGEAPLPGGEG